MNLQPLRIEAGWQVDYNQFYEVDPLPGKESYFTGSSLLILKNQARLKSIDVEWSSEGELSGEYRVNVLNYLENYTAKSDTYDIAPDWEHPVLVYSTRSRLELVDQLENLMRRLPIYEDPRICSKRGVIDQPSESYRIELENKGPSNELLARILHDGNAKIQRLLIDHTDITKEHLAEILERSISKKVKNKALQRLKSRAFRH
jgi:hypothetical protein